MANAIKTIGVLTSGGDAPGMNAAIRAVVRSGIAKGLNVKGIYKGYNGLINGEIEDLTARSVSDTISRGGTMLYTARCAEMRTPEGQAQAAKVCRENGIEGVGTTFSGILFVGDQYIIGHVGDTRVYHIGTALHQLTTDQTFVAREISRGTLTLEQAKTDKRRNLLLQCVGASKTVEPQIICGKVEKGAYMLCSDGFRHEISEAEIYESLNPINLMNKDAMHNNAKYLIEQVKKREEKDNISVLLIKAE